MVVKKANAASLSEKHMIEAHRLGYELASIEAAKRGCKLTSYAEAIAKHDEEE